MVLEQEQDPSLANSWIQAQVGKGGFRTHKGLLYPKDQVEGQAVSQFCVPQGRRAKILQLARESTLSDVQPCCNCYSRARSVTTDRVPITPITRIDVPFQVMNVYRISPSLTAKAVVDGHECSVSHEKEAEFGCVMTPTPACGSAVVCSPACQSDKIAHLTPERRQELLQVLDDFADQFIDSPGPGDPAVHRTTTTADFVPCQRRPYYVTPEVVSQSKEMLDRGLVRPSDSPRPNPSVCVARRDGGGRSAGDYRHLNLVYGHCTVYSSIVLFICILCIVCMLCHFV